MLCLYHFFLSIRHNQNELVIYMFIMYQLELINRIEKKSNFLVKCFLSLIMN